MSNVTLSDTYLSDNYDYLTTTVIGQYSVKKTDRFLYKVFSFCFLKCNPLQLLKQFSSNFYRLLLLKLMIKYLAINLKQQKKTLP